MKRKKQLKQWLKEQLPQLGLSAEFTLTEASEDASFRRYYRVSAEQSLILMDAPPKHEDCRPFVQIQKRLADSGVAVPQIYAQDFELGCLLLEDLGSQLFLDLLNSETADDLYRLAIRQIGKMQKIKVAGQLPEYSSSLLLQEMQLFSDWFINQHLGYRLSQQQTECLEKTQQLLINNALQQPQVFVHRDFHSRNLMWHRQNCAVIDFQDAVLGPFSYDLVSLLKDCYIAWDEEKVNDWVDYFRESYNRTTDSDISQAQLLRWFDLMGVQRQLKAIGIFCRLNYRDGKKKFLYDIPRTMQYLTKTCCQYPELEAFGELLAKLQPKLL